MLHNFTSQDTQINSNDTQSNSNDTHITIQYNTIQYKKNL